MPAANPHPPDTANTTESGQDGVSTYSTLLYNLASAQEEAARLSILMGEHQVRVGVVGCVCMCVHTCRLSGRPSEFRHPTFALTRLSLPAAATVWASWLPPAARRTPQEQLLLDQEMMSQARRDLARVTKSRDEAAAQNMALHKRLTEARAAIVAVERENVQMKSAVAATRAALEAAHGKIQSLQSQMISAAESSQERREQQAAAVQEALALQQAAHVQQLQAFEAQVSEARADWAAYEEAKERELEELRDALRQQAESMAAASREALEAQARKAGQQLAEAQAAAAAERAVMQQQAQAAAAKAEAQLGAAAAEVQSVRLSLRQQIEAQQAAAKVRHGRGVERLRNVSLSEFGPRNREEACACLLLGPSEAAHIFCRRSAKAWLALNTVVTKGS